VSLIENVEVERPVVQAGMGGGIAGAELAGGVSAAGGLGTVGILPPEELREELRRAGEVAGGRPVAANLLVPFARRAHVDACRAGGAVLVVLHGGFDRRLVGAVRDAGLPVLVTVGTPSEAAGALRAGADGLVVQGREAGGHLVGVEPALDALSGVRAAAGETPLWLAGGIADAADARRALDAGATAVVAGTRFLLTHESGAHPGYKQRVLRASRTLETQLFGLSWPMRHRVVPNAATDRWCAPDGTVPRPLRAFHAASVPLAHLPMSAVRGAIRTQDPRVPVFGPPAPVRGLPDRLVDASALYAGETALRIDSILPAADAVARLAGSGPTTPRR
jgi:NAD(P)H-dependent flavin oxidoreductase YrpB (nitropropane dioxygenase family)